MKLDNFEQVAEFGEVTKLEQQVDTPVPEDEDGSGFTTEKNRQVCYTMGEHTVKVQKVSDKGWTVTHYVDGEIEWMQMQYDDQATDAHSTAREKIEEVFAE